jgi:hypothetical protein
MRTSTMVSSGSKHVCALAMRASRALHASCSSAMPASSCMRLSTDLVSDGLSQQWACSVDIDLSRLWMISCFSRVRLWCSASCVRCMDSRAWSVMLVRAERARWRMVEAPIWKVSIHTCCWIACGQGPCNLRSNAFWGARSCVFPEPTKFRQ